MKNTMVSAYKKLSRWKTKRKQMKVKKKTIYIEHTPTSKAS